MRVYNSVSLRDLAILDLNWVSTFLLKFMANFDDEAKGMLPFIGNTIEADITLTKNTFNWSPISFEKTVLDTANSVQSVLNKKV